MASAFPLESYKWNHTKRKSQPVHNLPLITGLLGVILVAGVLIRTASERIGIPALVGYILLGFLLRALFESGSFLPQSAGPTLDFLGTVGVVFLLFGVGLKTDVAALRRVLGRAGQIWIGNILVSGSMGFVAARFLLGVDFLASLLVAVALTATSVGVSVGTWDSRDALESEEGKLLLDVAELDDISAVVLMAVLFAILPTLRGSQGGLGLAVVGKTVLLFSVKGLGFGLFCLLFARVVEPHLAEWMSREGQPSRIVLVSGVGLIIASMAGGLGFSVAIGAFFAGMVFSIDPEKIREELSFKALHAFFVPFFFLGLGFKIEPSALGGALVPGLVFLAAAVVGKFVGVSLPALRIVGPPSAFLLGMSMVPRAEIAMIVMERGLNPGHDLVAPELFGAMVLVTLLTSTLLPILMGWGLEKSTLPESK